MGFKVFLESAKDIEALLPEIEKNCQFYLKNFGPLYRGMKVFDHSGEKKRRTDRKPRDTWEVFDQFINIWLKENKVISRSEGVFCYATEKGISEYGYPFLIFPQGKFNSYYIRGVNDLTMNLGFGSESRVYHKTIEDEMSEAFKKAKSSKEALKMMGDIYQDHSKKMDDSRENKIVLRDFKRVEKQLIALTKRKIVTNVQNNPAISNEEIVLDCDKYYYINMDMMSTTEGLRNKVMGLFK